MIETYYVQHVNQKVQDDYQELIKEYKKLKDNVKNLYSQENAKDAYEKNGVFLIDVAIQPNKEINSYFYKCKYDQKKVILSHLNSGKLKEDKVSKLFNIKKTRLKRHIENLDTETLGTSLNLLKEFYKSIYRDVERNSIKDYEFDFTNVLQDEGYKKFKFEYPENLNKKNREFNFRIGAMSE